MSKQQKVEALHKLSKVFSPHPGGRSGLVLVVVNVDDGSGLHPARGVEHRTTRQRS
jgi:hypothetical protein